MGKLTRARQGRNKQAAVNIAVAEKHVCLWGNHGSLCSMQATVFRQQNPWPRCCCFARHQRKRTISAMFVTFKLLVWK